MQEQGLKQNIGIFDSGLGGLLVLKHLRELMPDYNYVFYGDQAHVPYGEKSIDELLMYSKQALNFLYKEKNCMYVLLACNTTSSNIYDDLKKWVMETFPGKKVFGIVRPTVLSLPEFSKIVVFGTHRTIESHNFKKHIFENFSNTNDESVIELELKNLASMIENDQDTFKYLQDFSYRVPNDATTAILGCTHYGLAISSFKSAFPQIKKWVMQEEIIPPFFKNYIDSKPEEKHALATDSSLEIYVSKENPVFSKWKDKWFGEKQEIELVK